MTERAVRRDSVQILIDELIPDPNNARRHNEYNIGMIAESLRRFGQVKPVVINQEKRILAGHGLVEAAKLLGWTHVAVIVVDGWSAEDERDYAIADNRTAETSDWELEQLRAALNDGADLSWLWADDALAALLAGLEDESGPKTAGGDPDEAPEPPAVPITKPEDLWILGDHRLLCGDATSPADIARLMAGHKADMVWTDPPYGMDLDTDYAARSRGKAAAGIQGRAHEAVEGDDEPFDPRPLLKAFRATPEIFLWGADYYAGQLPAGKGSWFVWDKCVTGEGQVSQEAERMIGSNFELCWSKHRHKREIVRVFHRGFGTADRSKRVHPTQKPIQLAEWFIERFSRPGDIVADPYSGSGTSIMAGERLQRPVRAMELDAGYCDVTIQRWEALSGLSAVRG